MIGFTSNQLVAAGVHRTDTCKKGKRFCLVTMCMMSGWPEVFPFSKSNTQAVVQTLLIHVISTFGRPEHAD